MFTRDTVDDLLARLGKRHGVADLVLNEDGYGSLGVLTADEVGLAAEIELRLDEEAGELALVGSLVVPAVSADLMQTLLEANSLYAAPGDDILGLDAAVPCVVLTRWLQAPLDVETLAGTLDDFAASVESWRSALALDEPTDDSPPAPPMDPAMRS